MRSFTRSSAILAAIMVVAGAATAQSVAPVERTGAGEATFGPTQIVFKPGIGKVGLALSVSGRDGYSYTRVYQPGVNPTFSVSDLADGLYSFELRVVQASKKRDSGEHAEGRVEAPSAGDGSVGSHDTRPQDAVVESGHFQIKGGSLVLNDVVERGSETPVSELELTGQTGLPDKDICYNDDLIVDGSLCVGFDCTCNYSFGFDTIVLKENNLRIFFDDTSTAASFPRNDWRIVINDSANGGASYFGIEDSTAGRRPFSVEAGAPSHSLYVDDGGRIGFGTSTPVVNLHVKEGNTPTLRLEQDGSSGFAPQTWDVAGNETNFFIRDVTHGSSLPFRIRPDAPTNSIFVDVDGEVGFGTASPAEAGHILRSDASGMKFEVENSNATAQNVGIRLSNSTSSWDLRSNTSGDFAITLAGSGSNEMVLDTLGNLEITGDLTVVGGCSGCDAVFQPGYDLESIEEHAALMWEKQFLPAVGPTPEGKTKISVFQKTTGILNELEKAHIYIEQLHTIIQEMQIEHNAAIADLQIRLEKLEGSPNE